MYNLIIKIISCNAKYSMRFPIVVDLIYCLSIQSTHYSVRIVLLIYGNGTFSDTRIIISIHLKTHEFMTYTILLKFLFVALKMHKILTC